MSFREASYIEVPCFKLETRKRKIEQKSSKFQKFLELNHLLGFLRKKRVRKLNLKLKFGSNESFDGPCF